MVVLQPYHCINQQFLKDDNLNESLLEEKAVAGFLDKVVVGLNKGVNAFSEGSKLLVEKATLNSQIQDTEKEKNKLLQSMGTLVFNLIVNGEIQLEQCNGMCTEIAAYNKKIGELQQQLQALDAAKVQQPQYVAPEAQAPQDGGIQCQCGCINKAGAKFCSKCGQAL